MIRDTVVSGIFYPLEYHDLIEMIEYCYLNPRGPKKLPSKLGRYEKPIGVISPHAGYVYSGPIAAHSYKEISKKVSGNITAVIIGPNHSGMGSVVSTMEGIWKTPLGNLEIDNEFSERLWKECDIIDLDETAHLKEHSIEVQLPFLKHLELLNIAKFKFVPISMSLQDYDTAVGVGYMVAKVAKELNRKIIIIASSDFSHYEPEEIASKKDAIIIKDILKMEEEEIFTDVVTNNVTMCGYGPIIAMIKAMKVLGAKESKLLSYSTSGDVTKDYSEVVGYGALIIE
ncbi:protein of unknown function DUF52 [Methanococcus vannielii SB]|uniref:MEMO1 family protein Mevan_0697 n=1 Tax=Methanococcus vannielii (strain ATCC 35089 / DSM 1224 / JCM 13029 / OCM 148 / SB) TaxID=406327 RepID=Y697_METVS|nr:MEMO1 family protein [Methanococcus vannielii]A6UQ31.1 RecName: Full=MEMO1 family protein Mevan_0697 [Methanococcus vannielii SB]ABR54603.1 protein of unknown function DUF52 [Methanococcus vannielii SB]